MKKDNEQKWLDPETRGTKNLLPLLVPYSGDDMESYELSCSVNSPKNDKPDYIAKVKSER